MLPAKNRKDQELFQSPTGITQLALGAKELSEIIEKVASLPINSSTTRIEEKNTVKSLHTDIAKMHENFNISRGQMSDTMKNSEKKLLKSTNEIGRASCRERV